MIFLLLSFKKLLESPQKHLPGPFVVTPALTLREGAIICSPHVGIALAEADGTKGEEASSPVVRVLPLLQQSSSSSAHVHVSTAGWEPFSVQSALLAKWFFFQTASESGGAVAKFK